MTKLLVFLLASLLFCSDVQMGRPQHFDHPVREMEFSHDKEPENKEIVFCKVCKFVLGKVIGYIGKTVTKDEVNRQLDRICEKIKIPGCKRFLEKYKNKLVNALLTGDKASAICIKLSLCKPMGMQTIQ